MNDNSESGSLLVVGTRRVVRGVVLAGPPVEAVGVDASAEEHEVEDGHVEHRLDDGDAAGREHGVVPADDLNLLFLAGLPVDGPLFLRDGRGRVERQFAVHRLAGGDAALDAANIVVGGGVQAGRTQPGGIPTGIKAGVSILPRNVSIKPNLACIFFSITFICKPCLCKSLIRRILL